MIDCADFHHIIKVEVLLLVGALIKKCLTVTVVFFERVKQQSVQSVRFQNLYGTIILELGKQNCSPGTRQQSSQVRNKNHDITFANTEKKLWKDFLRLYIRTKESLLKFAAFEKFSRNCDKLLPEKSG